MATPVAVAAALYDATSGLAAGTIPFPYQSMIAGHVTVVPDPLGGGFNVMRFAIADSDRPYSGASDPRADFRTPSLFSNGSDLYSSIRILIPTGFPVLKSRGFFQVAEIYGPPYGGSPTIGIDLFPGAGGRPLVALGRDAAHGYDRPWTGPTLNTGWHTITIHSIMSTSASVGEVQVWFDGQPQTFSNGSQTIHYVTLGSSNWDGRSANFLQVNQYRRAGAYPGTVVTYHAAAKVGTTLGAVDTSSTPVPPVFRPVVPEAGPLVAAFTAPSSAKIGMPVVLDAAASHGAVHYVWKDTGPKPAVVLGSGSLYTRTFHYAGTKKVQLTVTDAAGNTATVEHDLTVS